MVIEEVQTRPDFGQSAGAKVQVGYTTAALIKEVRANAGSDVADEHLSLRGRTDVPRRQDDARRAEAAVRRSPIDVTGFRVDRPVGVDVVDLERVPCRP